MANLSNHVVVKSGKSRILMFVTNPNTDFQWIFYGGCRTNWIRAIWNSCPMVNFNSATSFFHGSDRIFFHLFLKRWVFYQWLNPGGFVPSMCGWSTVGELARCLQRPGWTKAWTVPAWWSTRSGCPGWRAPFFRYLFMMMMFFFNEYCEKNRYSE